MRKVLVVLCIAFVSLGYFGYSYLSRPHGDQKVAYQPAKIECGSGKSGKWKYCIHHALQGTNGGIAYLLHGRNLDEHTWNDDTFYTSLVQDYWQNSHQRPPVVVTVSFGPVWLLAPKNSKASSGLLGVFQNDVIPEMESTLGRPKYRVVFGESMGGLNSLIAGLATGMFQKVAALCPGVYKDSPFSSFSVLKGAIERTGAEPLVTFGIVSIAKAYASNDDEWSSLNPLKLVDRVYFDASPVFYISAPLYDKYGNFEGAQELAKKLKDKGVKTIWRPLYGGHCAVDIASLAEFLL